MNTNNPNNQNNPQLRALIGGIFSLLGFDSEGNPIRIARGDVFYYFTKEFHNQGLLRRLKGAPLSVLHVLMVHADSNARAFPSVDRICEQTGYSRNSVKAALKTLVDCGLVDVQQQRNERGEFTHNVYYLRWMADRGTNFGPRDEHRSTKIGPRVESASNKDFDRGTKIGPRTEPAPEADFHRGTNFDATVDQKLAAKEDPIYKEERESSTLALNAPIQEDDRAEGSPLCEIANSAIVPNSVNDLDRSINHDSANLHIHTGGNNQTDGIITNGRSNPSSQKEEGDYRRPRRPGKAALVLAANLWAALEARGAAPTVAKAQRPWMAQQARVFDEMLHDSDFSADDLRRLIDHALDNHPHAQSKLLQFGARWLQWELPQLASAYAGLAENSPAAPRRKRQMIPAILLRREEC